VPNSTFCRRSALSCSTEANGAWFSAANRVLPIRLGTRNCMDCQGRLWHQRLPTYKSLSKEFTVATGHDPLREPHVALAVFAYETRDILLSEEWMAAAM